MQVNIIERGIQLPLDFPKEGGGGFACDPTVSTTAKDCLTVVLPNRAFNLSSITLR